MKVFLADGGYQANLSFASAVRYRRDGSILRWGFPCWGFWRRILRDLQRARLEVGMMAWYSKGNGRERRVRMTLHGELFNGSQWRASIESTCDINIPSRVDNRLFYFRRVPLTIQKALLDYGSITISHSIIHHSSFKASTHLSTNNQQRALKRNENNHARIQHTPFNQPTV